MAKLHLGAILVTGLAAWGACGAAPASAQSPTFRVGDVVECDGNMTGTVVRIQPRPGWDEPFYIVRTEVPMTTYESKCLARTMRAVDGSRAAARQPTRQAHGAPRPAAGAHSQTGALTFRIGDAVMCDGNMSGTVVRIEPRPGWDEPFYIVHSKGSTTTNEIKCLLRRMRHVAAVAEQPIRHPEARAQAAPLPASRPAAGTAAAQQPGGSRVPDGRYRCHKISPGGQLMDIGTLVMRGGRGTLEGLPDGWTVRSITMIRASPPLVAFDYTSAAGWNDRLDCVPQ